MLPGEKLKKFMYKGELLTVRQIAEKTKIPISTMRRHLRKAGENPNINDIIQQCMNTNLKLKQVAYNGKSRAQIAKENDIPSTSLHDAMKAFNNDLEKAIAYCIAHKETNPNKTKPKEKIFYKGEMLYKAEIARREQIPTTTLFAAMTRFDNNLEKAVMVCQTIKTKREEKKRRNEKNGGSNHQNLNYFDLSIILGINYDQFMQLIKDGISVDDIIEQKKSQKSKREIIKPKSEKIKMPDGQSVEEYCINNGLNYRHINRLIREQKMTPEEAIKQYLEHGQQIPQTWKFEIHEYLLKHVLLKEKINVDKVVCIMRDEQISLLNAIKKYIIERNVKEAKIESIKDWIYELYDVLTVEFGGDDYENYIHEFFVDRIEEECIKKSFDEIEKVKRHFLLLEILEAFEKKIFTDEEEKDVLMEYEITEDDIKEMYIELYAGFTEPGILKARNNTEIAVDEETAKKIERYIGMINDIQAEEAIRLTRETVGKQVGNNEKTRAVLQNEIVQPEVPSLNE